MFDTLYTKIADDLVENGYCVLQNTLSSKLNEKLYKLCEDEDSFTKAGISSRKQVHIDNTKRSTSIRWLNDDAAVQSEFLAFMQGVQEYLNRHLYLGLKYYESHFAMYNRGDFYEKHFDAFAHFKNRVVTTVYYLNEMWEEEDGGALIIYDEAEEILEKILPKMGTLVVFLSEQFAHEVLPSKKKRYSIAGWFRVDEKII